MSSETARRTRNALVGSGTTLLFYGLLGIVYAAALRSDATPCNDGGQALVLGACYRVWILMLPVVVAGLGLLLGGLYGARWQPEEAEEELHHSAGAHAVAWLLTSLVVLPLLLLAIQAYRQRLLDTVFTIELVGIPFKHIFLLELALLVGLLAWVPYMALMAVHAVKWRIFLARHEARKDDS